MIYIYYFWYNIAWSGMLVGYTVEILPYNIRAKGLTIMFLMVDAALFFNQYVNPIALDCKIFASLPLFVSGSANMVLALHWKYYIFYCVWIAFELVIVYFFYVETRNTPLEEIAKHFDGDAALLGGGVATEKGLSMATDLGLDGTIGHSTALEEKRRGLEVETVSAKH